MKNKEQKIKEFEKRIGKLERNISIHSRYLYDTVGKREQRRDPQISPSYYSQLTN